jgi:hypothetical protein
LYFLNYRIIGIASKLLAYFEHYKMLESQLKVEYISFRDKLKPNKKPIANLYRDLYPYPQFDFKDDRFQPLKDKLIDLFKGIK